MKCHTCGGELHPTQSDMPFKLGQKRIVIFKELPTLQCGECGEYLIEDGVMERIEEALEKSDQSAELEIVRYAA